MQAVILAAGSSTRTYPLTLTRPKPLLKVANRTILEYNLEAIKDIAEEIIIVLGYKKDMIKTFIKKNYPNLNIKFVEQHSQLGTGHAVSALKDKIKNKFVLMLGDNIYSKKDVNAILKHKYSILVKRTKNWQNFGVIMEKSKLLKKHQINKILPLLPEIAPYLFSCQKSGEAGKLLVCEIFCLTKKGLRQ